MRSFVLILEGVRAVLFHIGEAEIAAAPPNGDNGTTFGPTEWPLNSPRSSVAPATPVEKLLLGTGLTMCCNRAASCGVVCSGKTVGSRVCSVGSFILTIEDVREMILGGDDGELGFSAAVVDVAERATE